MLCKGALRSEAITAGRSRNGFAKPNDIVETTHQCNQQVKATNRERKGTLYIERVRVKCYKRKKTYDGIRGPPLLECSTRNRYHSAQ